MSDIYRRAKRLIGVIEGCVVHGYDVRRQRGAKRKRFDFAFGGRRYRWTLEFDRDGGAVLTQVAPAPEQVVFKGSEAEIAKLARWRIR